MLSMLVKNFKLYFGAFYLVYIEFYLFALVSAYMSFEVNFEIESQKLSF